MIVTTREAVRALEFGAAAEVAGLGDERAAEQYRTLVHLVLTAADGISDQVADKRLTGDLQRYAFFVQVSLENLVEYGQSLDPGAASEPTLARTPHDKSIWSPSIVPPKWQEAIERKPADPQYRPAE